MTGRKGFYRRRWVPGVVALLHRRRDLAGVSLAADVVSEAITWNA